MEPLSRDVCVLMCKTVLALCGLGLEIVYLVALIHVRLYISIAYCYDIFVYVQHNTSSSRHCDIVADVSISCFLVAGARNGVLH